MKKLSIILISLILSGCYSFTGGSIPEHLNTITISPVEDNSGFGFPQFQNQLAFELADAFRKDNSLQIVDGGGDAILTVRISNIQDATVSAGAGELETERKLSITLSCDYYDSVLGKDIFKSKAITNSLNYEIQNAQVNRDAAAEELFQQLANEVLLSVISGW